MTIFIAVSTLLSIVVVIMRAKYQSVDREYLKDICDAENSKE